MFHTMISSLKRHRHHAVAATAAVAVFGCVGIVGANAAPTAVPGEAATAVSEDTFWACVRKGDVQPGSITQGMMAPVCGPGTTVAQWNAQGPQGIPGTTAFGDDTQMALSGIRNQSSCYLGEVRLVAGEIAVGVPAQGQILEIGQHAALFTLLGDKYGGNGETTFALPDLTAAAPNGLTYSICTEGMFPQQDY